MAEFCGRVLGPEAEDRALSEYWMAVGRDVVPVDADVQRQMPLFAPWMVFNWEVTSAASSNKLQALQGKTVAEILLQDPASRMDSLERRVAEAGNRNPYRFFEVLRVDPGKRVYLQDVLIGSEHTVQERSGSHYMKPHDLLFGRVAAIDEVNMFIGLAPYLIPPSYKVGLIDLRNRLKAGKPSVYRGGHSSRGAGNPPGISRDGPHPPSSPHHLQHRRRSFGTA